jgi:tripartite-type tricarboxylate transporter receptor subunit TctC
MDRRGSLLLLAIGCTLAAPFSHAQNAASPAGAYPAKTVRIIVPFPPVGAADLLSRTIAQKVSESWSHQVIIDNRPGAGGNLGVELAAKSPPDGYTAVMAAVTTNAIGMSTYTKLGYNLEKDLAPVSLVGNVPHVLVAHPSLPAHSVGELIALGKSRPGTLNFASQGPGTLSHLEQELLKQMGGFSALHVPYKGSAPGLSDLIAGQVVLFFDSIPSSLPQIKAGKIRALGVASSSRSPALPDVPAIGESVKGFAADSWFGLMMPTGTPREIIARMNGEVQKALAQQETKDRLLSVGGVVAPGGPEQLAERVRADVAKWGRVARAAGVRID